MSYSKRYVPYLGYLVLPSTVGDGFCVVGRDPVKMGATQTRPQVDCTTARWKPFDLDHNLIAQSQAVETDSMARVHAEMFLLYAN